RQGLTRLVDGRRLTESEAFLLRSGTTIAKIRTAAAVNALCVCRHDRLSRSEFEESRVASQRNLIADLSNPRFWRITALCVGAVVATASHANAAYYYWGESNPGYYYYYSRPDPTFQPR